MEKRIVAEKIIKIGLEEVTTIRLVCQREGCQGGTAEIATARLTALVGETVCPSCGHAFPIAQVGGVAGLRALGMATGNLTGKKDFRFEFQISEPI